MAVPPPMATEVGVMAEAMSMLTTPVAAETVRLLEPAASERTPVFVSVIAPVAVSTLRPLEAVTERTPLFVMLTTPAVDVVQEVPVLHETEPTTDGTVTRWPETGTA